MLVVARGEGYKQDLHWVQPYIREQKPVLLAVDGGADALLEAGHRPHVIVGDMDSASDTALRCGAELVLHTYADGRPSPGRERLRQLGLAWVEMAVLGTSEDVAMLMAHQGGASLIVAVGTHFSMVDFLDKRRPGMASRPRTGWASPGRAAGLAPSGTPEGQGPPSSVPGRPEVAPSAPPPR